jgi:DNA-directed RNA polymerase subunit M/transcription elongation factor TFIIS
MSDNFCPKTYSLLSRVINQNKITNKSNKTGDTYEVEKDNLILYGTELGQNQTETKFRNTLQCTAFERINPSILHPCPNCGRKVVSFQIINNSMFYACPVPTCKNIWQ